MKVGLITEWFYPETGGAAHPGLIAKSLISDDTEVVALTGFPNYPSGEVYPGYRVKFHQKEFLDGVSVHRVAMYPSHDQSFFKRAFTFGTYALSAAIAAPWCLKQCHVNLAYSSPATAVFPAMIAKLFRRIPYVVYVQDLWPDTLVETGFTSSTKARALSKIIDPFVRATYRFAAHICVITQGMKNLLIERGVPPEKISVIPNWADEEHFYPTKGGGAKSGEKRVFLYAGNLGVAQSVEIIVEAARLLDRDLPLEIVVVGDGIAKESMQTKAKEYGLDNIVFHDAQPLDDVSQSIRSADVLLVTLRDQPLFEITMPSKVQASLASGRAIAAAVGGDAARVLSDSGAAIVTEPQNAEAFAESMKLLALVDYSRLEEMGRDGAKYYEANLSKEHGSFELQRVLRAAANL